MYDDNEDLILDQEFDEDYEPTKKGKRPLAKVGRFEAHAG
jgi:hypothetical protein